MIRPSTMLHIVVAIALTTVAYGDYSLSIQGGGCAGAYGNSNNGIAIWACYTGETFQIVQRGSSSLTSGIALMAESLNVYPLTCAQAGGPWRCITPSLAPGDVLRGLNFVETVNLTRVTYQPFYTWDFSTLGALTVDRVVARDCTMGVDCAGGSELAVNLCGACTSRLGTGLRVSNPITRQSYDCQTSSSMRDGQFNCRLNIPRTITAADRDVWLPVYIYATNPGNNIGVGIYGTLNNSVMISSRTPRINGAVLGCFNQDNTPTNCYTGSTIAIPVDSTVEIMGDTVFQLVSTLQPSRSYPFASVAYSDNGNLYTLVMPSVETEDIGRPMLIRAQTGRLDSTWPSSTSRVEFTTLGNLEITNVTPIDCQIGVDCTFNSTVLINGPRFPITNVTFSTILGSTINVQLSWSRGPILTAPFTVVNSTAIQFQLPAIPNNLEHQWADISIKIGGSSNVLTRSMVYGSVPPVIPSSSTGVRSSSSSSVVSSSSSNMSPYPGTSSIMSLSSSSSSSSSGSETTYTVTTSSMSDSVMAAIIFTSILSFCLLVVVIVLLYCLIRAKADASSSKFVLPSSSDDQSMTSDSAVEMHTV